MRGGHVHGRAAGAGLAGALGRAQGGRGQTGRRRGARARTRLRNRAPLIFSALAREREPDQFSLSRLRFAYAQAVAAGTLTPREDGGFGLDWRDDEPRRVRFAVAADAVALLADPARIARLHRCPGRDCGWIFLHIKRPPPVVLDGDLRQPREDAPDVRAQARRALRRSRVAASGSNLRSRDRPVGADQHVVLQADLAVLGVVDARLDGEDHALAQRDVRGQETRNGGSWISVPIAWPGAVQAGPEVRVGLDDVALGGVHASGGRGRGGVIATAAT